MNALLLATLLAIGILGMIPIAYCVGGYYKLKRLTAMPLDGPSTQRRSQQPWQNSLRIPDIGILILHIGLFLIWRGASCVGRGSEVAWRRKRRVTAILKGRVASYISRTYIRRDLKTSCCSSGLRVAGYLAWRNQFVICVEMRCRYQVQERVV